MRCTKAVIALFLAAFLCAPAVASQVLVKPFDLYARGDYLAAIAAGEKQNDGEGLAVAARAVLADANLRDTPCLECLERAEAYATRAIAADPKRADAHIFYAMALGYKARIVGMLRARFANYPELAKQALDTALQLSPNDAWTLCALGGWNLAVVQNGGAVLARMIYGATFEQGMVFFRRGIAADPENLVLHFQFALSLASYDDESNAQLLAAELKSAAEGMPRTAYEGVIKMRAAKLLELFRQGKREELLILVKKYQGYP